MFKHHSESTIRFLVKIFEKNPTKLKTKNNLLAIRPKKKYCLFLVNAV
jgi:hypothetical protein